MTIAEYRNQFKEEDAVGWQCIDQALEKLYGDKKGRHFDPELHYILGKTDPIERVTIYSNSSQNHYHLISYGMSTLYYDEESAEDKHSKYGFEFTMRIKPLSEDKGDPLWAIQVINNLARYVIKTGRSFSSYQFIAINEPTYSNKNTGIAGLTLVCDPELGKINTPHGDVQFLQIVGLTIKETEQLKAKPTVKEVRKILDYRLQTNPLLITDLKRM